VGSSVTNIKEIRMAQIAKAIETMTAIPPEMRMNNIEPYTANLYEAEKELYDAVEIKNPDRLLIKMPNQQQAQDALSLPTEGMGGLEQLMQIPYGQ
jgi:hypothetical protein